MTDKFYEEFCSPGKRLDESPMWECGVPYCADCEQPCEGDLIDVGVGSYEFWGQRGVDRDLQYLSDCCEAPVMMDGVPYVPANPKDEYDPAQEY